MATHKYGRGKFQPHANYLSYMEMIVSHPNFSGMPNARSADGRINWQVSSGKTTSFYEHYLARRSWWIEKADSLGIPGKGTSGKGRFTQAARMINPTGYHACRLCGEDFNVGYFYLTEKFAATINRPLKFPLMPPAIEP